MLAHSGIILTNPTGLRGVGLVYEALLARGTPFRYKVVYQSNTLITWDGTQEE